MYVGYRWYDQFYETPLFPFGHGLSYTTFSYSNYSVSPKPIKPIRRSKSSGVVVSTISITLQNTGSVAGSEVAQLYLGFPLHAREPPKLLKGFQKVIPFHSIHCAAITFVFLYSYTNDNRYFYNQESHKV